MSRGESTWNTNQLVPINRNGKLEEVYWTYSYSPVRDKEGAVRGTLVVCSETTEQVLSERRLRTLLGITAGAEALNELAEDQALARFAQAMVRNLSSDPADIPFAALYLFSQGQTVLAESTSPTAKPAEPGQWPWVNAMDAQGPTLVEDLQLRDVEMIRAPWREPVTRAYVSLCRCAGSSIRAVLVFGISPLLPFDERYQNFFQAIGAGVAASCKLKGISWNWQRRRRDHQPDGSESFGMVIGGLDAELRTKT